MLNKYEAMFLLRPDVSAEEENPILNHIQEIISKNEGKILSTHIFAKNRKLAYSIGQCNEALYYLVNFSIDSAQVSNLKQGYKLNEHILRFLIIKK